MDRAGLEPATRPFMSGRKRDAIVDLSAFSLRSAVSSLLADTFRCETGVVAAKRKRDRRERREGVLRPSAAWPASSQAIQMALRMVGLIRTKTGEWSARKGIPADVRDEYERLYCVRWAAGRRLKAHRNYVTRVLANFDRASTERLLSSINIGALARTSPNKENQLISLWSAVEVSPRLARFPDSPESAPECVI